MPETVTMPERELAPVLEEQVILKLPFPLPLEAERVIHVSVSVTVQLIFDLTVAVKAPPVATTVLLSGSTTR